MDFAASAGTPMDVFASESESLFNSASDDKEDHVVWQASQSCQAFNQLLKSNTNDRKEGEGVEVFRASVWGRHQSFDQIPGFSALSTSDKDEGSSSSTSRVRSDSSSKSSRPSLSRQRHPDARSSSLTAPQNATSELQIPFFDKTNPGSFLDMLKGVSARMDENAGVRKKEGVVASSGKATRPTRKRARPVSLGEPSSSKKGRTDVLGSIEGPARTRRDKGKSRALPEDEDFNMQSSHLFEHKSMPNVLSPVDTPSRSVEQARKDDAMDVVDFSGQSSMPSRSQIDMPPPPPPAPPTKHPSPQSQTSVVAWKIPLSQSTSHPQRKPKKPEPAATLHPLLQIPTSQSDSSSRPRSQAQPSKAVVRPNIHGKPPLSRVPVTVKTEPSPEPPSSNPGKPSSRLPALGMRRTHTYPTQSTAGTTNNRPKGGPLPTKQKGFKPPLLSSQPQTQTVAVKAEPVIAIVHAATRRGVAKSPPSKHEPRSPAIQAPASSNGSSTSSDSFRSSTSGSSIYTTPTATFDSPRSRVQSPPESAPCTASSSALPEPADADGDSSFGDIMSFDMDALEETMRLYD